MSSSCTLIIATQTDCFEDASDELQEPQADGRPRGQIEPPASRAQCKADVQRASLKARLDETAEILRMALSNEFTRALESCEDR